ncbi:MAG TPA: flagellar hook-basal body complex protein [Candidatus Mucispirillum faecigallinarum]|uniref:Flagellar hook protein FlgE n=1 Tax=Candidatus Mucispirillum faecigallinarum TaxID=2838699 RepID=A0A9D2GTK2_9BACT|nr:flagellar hook-basal body complex protein [Candidatus Mucispirillum faecigallinarum]
MLKSLYNAVSGLGANQKAMDVLGNNIANVNTIGFKSSRAVFQDLMSQTLIGGKTPTDSRGGINPRQVGNGVYLAAVDTIFTAGVLKSTSSTTDLAIQGTGLFVVRGEGSSENYYTRAGDFNFDNTNTLTTPSGYRVQGWMSDPDTGVLNKQVSVGDIVLGTNYQVMKPKASTEISMSGALNTTATASTVTYGKLLTQASAKQDVNSMLSSSGVAMDLADGEKVRITASPTLYTPMSQLSDKNGTSLGISELNGNVTFRINGSSYSLNYTSLGGGSLNDGKYTTIEDFLQEVNNIFMQATKEHVDTATNTAGTPIATMTFKDGKFAIEANYGHEFEINGISGSSQLAALLSPLATTYKAGKTEYSSTINYQKEVTYQKDFTSIEQLADRITNSVNGGIVPNGFNAEFLDNNFGLNEGEGISFDNITVYDSATGTAAATLKVGPFTYTETVNPTIRNQFHTIQELGRLITDAVNEQLAITNVNGVPVTTRVSFGLDGNKLSFSVTGASNAISFGESTLHQALGSTATPNTYLKMIFDNSLNTYGANDIVTPKQLNDVVSTVDIDPIAGKGRIVYNYEDTEANTLVDMSTNNLYMQNGETLVFRLANMANPIILEYNTAGGGATPPAQATFTNATTLAQQLQAQIRAQGGANFANVTVNYDQATNTFTVNSGNPAQTISFSRIETTAKTPFLKEMLSSGLVGQNITNAGYTIEGESNIVDSITGLDITKANKGEIFNNNMFAGNTTGTLGIGKSITSEQFLTTADETTLMMDLFNENGNYMNFVENQSTLEMKGSINKEQITNNGYFSIGATSTVADYMLAMEKFVDLNGGHNTFDNVVIENGIIKVTGEKGARNNIDYLTVTATGGSETSNTIFNNAMQGTTTAATGGIAYRTMEVYDEQGNKHNINFTFSLWNEELNEWRMEIATDDPLNDVAINGASQNELILRFNSDGTLSHMYDRFTVPSKVIANPTLRFSAANGTNTINPIALNLGTAGENDGLSIAANGGGITKASTDGYTVGDLTKTMFNTAGELVGTYSNGQTRVLAQVALATFVNERGLEKVGDTMFQATGASGQATIGEPMTGDRGEIAASMLENSNVDLSTELVNMITTERAYQSNSKTISTSDEMIQELLNMKR